MENKTCIIRVSGRVQGVAFRHYTKLQADRIGITGWVRNERDGSVEAMISGTGEQIEDMIAWLHTGPPSAIVEKVEISDVQDAERFTSFDIRY